MDGPHHRLKIYTSPQSGRTPPWVKNLQIHEVNGPHHGLKFIQVLKMDGPHHGLKILQVHEVNGPHYGLKIYTNSRSRRT